MLRFTPKLQETFASRCAFHVLKLWIIFNNLSWVSLDARGMMGGVFEGLAAFRGL